MLHEISLENEARELEAMAEMLENIEDGLGADGVGHGRLRPPAEPIAITEPEQT